MITKPPIYHPAPTDEIKHDGYRLIVHRDGPTVRLYSRNAYDWTARLAVIAAAAEGINAESFTIDGEAVVLGPDGLSRFDELSRREAARTAILYAFDLIELDGEDLRRRAVLDRRAALEQLLGGLKAGILLNEHIAEDRATVFLSLRLRNAGDLGGLQHPRSVILPIGASRQRQLSRDTAPSLLEAFEFADQPQADSHPATKSSLSEGAAGTALASGPLRRKTHVEEKENRMKVSKIMTRDVCLASPSQTLREAAAEMEKRDIGVLPVADKDRLVGMITDRDIAVRGISHGLDPEAPVSDVMSGEVKYCFEDDDIDNLAQNMASEQIRRLPVLNDQKRLVGIISLGDLATSPDGRATGAALSGISQLGGRHCQSAAG